MCGVFLESFQCFSCSKASVVSGEMTFICSYLMYESHLVFQLLACLHFLICVKVKL